MLLENCSYLGERRIKKGSIRVEGDIISEVGKGLKKAKGEESADLKERLILPGLICMHAHAYGAFGFAFKQKKGPKNFIDILEKLWWPLDESLNREGIYHSALLTSLFFLRNGVTTIFDHHASGSLIKGSLRELSRGFKETNLRVSLCYEVSDRYGEEKARDAIDENISSIRGGAHSLGLHSSFTLSDKTLEACSKTARSLNAGVHLHVAEGMVDNEDAVKRGYSSAVDRLNSFGLLNEKTIAAHCVNVSESDIKILAEKKVNVATCPGSNCNNGVGIMPYGEMRRKNVSIVLGNDSFGYDMLEEARRFSFIQSLREKRPSAFSDDGVRMLFETNPSVASGLFGKPLGRIEREYCADLIVFDSKPLGDGISSLESRAISDVMVNGEWVIEDKRLVNTDVEEKLLSFEPSEAFRHNRYLR